MGSGCRKPEMSTEFDVVVPQADLSDFVDGQMKEVQLLDDPKTSALLVKHQGQIHALSNKCTHYGAPLVKGSYCKGRGIVRCPWHGNDDGITCYGLISNGMFP